MATDRQFVKLERVVTQNKSPQAGQAVRGKGDGAAKENEQKRVSEKGKAQRCARKWQECDRDHRRASSTPSPVEMERMNGSAEECDG